MPGVSRRYACCHASRDSVEKTLLLLLLLPPPVVVTTDASLSMYTTIIYDTIQIVFVYCDDYLQRCFDLPWFHDPEWRALLSPAFETLGVPVERVGTYLPALLSPLPEDTMICPL